MIVIAVLVAVSAALVYRRDGIVGVTEILTSDLSLFGGGGALIDHTTVRAVALVGGLLTAAAALVMLSEPLLARRGRAVPECRHDLCEEPV